ncbi:B-cell receptor-associated protein 29 [Esox lucius]|uniref:Endoplasmic reticulum transmembrane protein n=1 Tax=Esox lucius TaxID=8010 RepID=A0A3P8ZM12_ESOLU|nr:B-cell receptor-associated protein 29 [Esox lucius]XP_019896187.1 B-cell receptor-associated protein 29 [Esox lucius]XP_019896188.1 B-cell receptor-associated protein 29 [Esox lucius]
MTLQWTAVAIFLYVEIVVILILCLPFISAKRWRSLFNLNIWSWFSLYWNKGFFTIILVLILLFCDALREVRKYSSAEAGPMGDAKLNPNLFDHLHMKLFRSQRNLYISGFSLFLWLVMQRLVTLINQVAVATANRTSLQTQAENANEAARRYQEDNLLLKQALLDEEKDKVSSKQQLRREAEKLMEELKAAEDAVRKANAEVEAMKRQARGLTKEYDRLLTEHTQLQQNLHAGAAEGSKKDL